MKSLFKIVAKKILVEELPIKTDSLPKTVLTNYWRYMSILLTQDYNSKLRIPPLPIIPEECFVFYGGMNLNFVNLSRTFDRAEKVMDPVDIFIYYVGFGNLEGLRRLWNMFDDHQKARIYDYNDEVVIFFADYFETGVVLPWSQLFYIYGKAKFNNFNISSFIFKLCPVPLRGFILICEFCDALISNDIVRILNSQRLAGLVRLKDFQMELGELTLSATLEATIRSNYSRFLMLPKNCRIPEVEDFVRERIGPYEPIDVPDSDYPLVSW